MGMATINKNFKVTQMKPFGALVEPANGKTRVQDLDVEQLRDLFRKNQIVVLRGFETFQNADGFADYCDAWGEVSLWPFGKVLELLEQDNPEDHIFDHRYVPLHWDGMYRPQVPEYQIFHCPTAPLPGQGGRTTFSNTILVLENATPEQRKVWDKVTGLYQRKMEFYNSKTRSPIVTKHPFRDDVAVIRYNEPPSEEEVDFVNPPILEFDGIDEHDLKAFHKDLTEALYSPNSFYAHEWQTGDVVIADNFSLLHGREGFVSKSPRHIQRVHVLSNPPLDNPGLESYK